MAATQTQNNLTDDEVSTIRALLSAIPSQAGAQGTTAGVANVPQGSSPEISADAAQSISGGPTQNGGNGMQGNQTQQQPQPNAYQKGVNKMLLQAGQQHAQQAIQAGIDPNAIASHPAMQPAQPMGGATGSWTPAQQSAISNVVAAAPKQTQVPTGQAQSRVTQTPSMYMNNPYQVPTGIQAPTKTKVPTGKQDNKSQPQSIEDKTQANLAQARFLQSQSIAAESKPKNFLQRFADNFSKMEGGMTSTDRIANLQTLQNIAGGQPIQPLDAAKLDHESKIAALTANGQLIEAASQPTVALSSMYRDQLQTRGIVGNFRQMESPAMGDTKQKLLDQLDRLKTYAQTQQILIGVMNPQAQNIEDLINEAKKRAASGNNKFQNYK